MFGFRNARIAWTDHNYLTFLYSKVFIYHFRDAIALHFTVYEINEGNEIWNVSIAFNYIMHFPQ